MDAGGAGKSSGLSRSGIERRQDSLHLPGTGVQEFGALATGRANFEMRLQARDLGLAQLAIVECPQLPFGWMHGSLLSERYSRSERYNRSNSFSARANKVPTEEGAASSAAATSAYDSPE